MVSFLFDHSIGVDEWYRVSQVIVLRITLWIMIIDRIV